MCSTASIKSSLNSCTTAPADFTLSIAVTLARIGILHLGTPVHVADATGGPLMHLEQFAEEIRRVKQEGDLVLVALAPAAENPITVALAWLRNRPGVTAPIVGARTLGQLTAAVQSLPDGRVQLTATGLPAH